MVSGDRAPLLPSRNSSPPASNGVFEVAASLISIGPASLSKTASESLRAMHPVPKTHMIDQAQQPATPDANPRRTIRFICFKQRSFTALFG
jgi:hypothetical protein